MSSTNNSLPQHISSHGLTYYGRAWEFLRQEMALQGIPQCGIISKDRLRRGLTVSGVCRFQVLALRVHGGEPRRGWRQVKQAGLWVGGLRTNLLPLCLSAYSSNMPRHHAGPGTASASV